MLQLMSTEFGSVGGTRAGTAGVSRSESSRVALDDVWCEGGRVCALAEAAGGWLSAGSPAAGVGGEEEDAKGGAATGPAFGCRSRVRLARRQARFAKR